MASISGKTDPVVRAVTVADVIDALGQGLRDFQAAPLFGLAFGALYALGGVAHRAVRHRLGGSYLAYPLAAGFALIGPFAAVGLYEVSRRRAAGEPLDLERRLGVVRAQGRRELGWMAFVTLFVFIVWMYQVARVLVALFLGLHASASLRDFIDAGDDDAGGHHVSAGRQCRRRGAVAGPVSLTVVSFPLLLDRDVDFVTAMITSVRAVATSPVPMIGWAAVDRRRC